MRLAFGLVVLAFLLIAPSGFAFRQDWRDDNYLLGYLTYKGGKTGIAWDPTAPSDAAGPPMDPAAGVKTAAGWNARVLTGSDQALIRRIEFVSEPLSRTLWLNASRLMEVDLYLDMGPCEASSSGYNLFYTKPVDVELWNGDTFVGGAVDQASPTSNAILGISLKEVRLQTEVDHLPAGTSLRLVVIARDHCDFQFGLAKPHRSMIRIPFYSEYDLAFRIPTELVKAGGSPPGGGSPSSPAPVGAPFGGGLILALLPLMAARPRRKAALAVLVLLASSFGGCLSASGSGARAGATTDGTAGYVTVTIDEPGPGGKVGNGSMAGLVHDDAEVPVEGAHVSLLGTSNFSSTDRLGRFLFPSLKPGEYTVRVDRAGYHSAEAKAGVKPGAVTRVTIGLFLLTAKTDNFRPHRHDSWPGPTKPVSLLNDGNVKFDGPCSQTPPLVPAFGIGAGSCGTAAFSSGPFPNEVADISVVPARGEMILPGTSSIDVKVSWGTSDGTMDRVGLAFFDNHDPNRSPSRDLGNNGTLMYPKGNGETTRIQTNWEMTDVGHQKLTGWLFYLYWPSQGSASPGFFSPVAAFDVPPQNFHVEMTLNKGVVPLEAAHRDFWGTNTTFVSLRSADCSLSSGLITIGTRACGVRPSELVPPETEWIEVVANRTADDPTNYPLTYTPNQYDAEKPIPRASNSGKTNVYRAKVTEDETDSFYAPVTGWTFYLYDPETAVPVYTTSTSFEVSVISHKGPMPG